MSAYEDSLILLKSLALIEKTKRRVQQVDENEFPTTSSEVPRSLLLSALNKLADRQLWASGTPGLGSAASPEALYNALIRLQELVEEVESSNSANISSPLVSYCDHIWGLLFPQGKQHIFYSVTSEHNYKISSFSDKLRKRLHGLLTPNQIAEVLAGNDLYCLQLASLENENLPLYANIGHEFGHAICWTNEKNIFELLEKESDQLLEAILKTLQAQDSTLAHRPAIRSIFIIRNLATEMFCDLIGSAVAGPAFLLSLHEMAWGTTNQGYWIARLVPDDHAIVAYPSFRFRLGKVKAWTEAEQFGNNVKRHFQELFEDPFKQTAEYLSGIPVDSSNDRFQVFPAGDNDSKAIQSALSSNLPILKQALDGFLARCKTEFLPTLSAAFRSISDREVSELLRRLDNDILPNIIPDGTLLGIPAGFGTILNASALFRISVLLRRKADKGPTAIFRDIQKLERLTAKALEVSYVQKEYKDWQMGQKQ